MKHTTSRLSASRASASRASATQTRHLTLLLQCHGAIHRGPVVSSSNVKVYSLVGAPGLRAEISKSANPEDKGQTSDFLLGTVVHDVYRYELHHRAGISHTELLDKLTEPLKDLYTDCDISYPRGFEIQDNPKEFRKFYFHPSDHENCRSCIRTGSKRCSYPRIFGTRTTENDIVWCPEYGIFPVLSSDEHDYTHTIVSIGEKDRIGVKRTLSRAESNVPSDTIFIEPKNIIGEAARAYWRNKIVHNPDLRDGEPLREKLLDDFDTLCQTQEITIDRLVNVFQLGMGYTHLYIIDPSCRSYMNARGEPITDEELRANPRGRWQYAIDSTLQTLSRSQSRSAAGETITPACVYTRRRHPGPERRDTKSRGSCVMMGGGGRTQRMRGRRRRRHTRERRRRS